MKPSEIQAKETELQEAFRPRNELMQQERRLLEPELPLYEQQPAWRTAEEAVLRARRLEKFVGNNAATFWRTTVALLSHGIPLVFIPKGVATGKEEGKVSKTESALQAILFSVDERWRRRGHDSWLVDLTEYTCGGAVVAFPFIQEGKKGPQFCCDLWDPIEVFPEWGAEGLELVIRSYATTQQSAVALADSFGVKLNLPPNSSDKDAVKIINAWYYKNGKVWNTVMAGADVLKEAREAVERIPIVYRVVGGTPFRAYEKGPDYTKTMSRSILRDNLTIFSAIDRMRTLYLNYLALMVNPQKVMTTKTGESGYKAEDLVGQGGVIELETGDAYQMVAPPSIAGEVRQVLTDLYNEEQKGGLPVMGYGTPPYGLSGFAMLQLDLYIKRKYGRYITARQSVISDILHSLLTQYIEGKHKKVSLVSPYQDGRTNYHQEEFGPKDICITPNIQIMDAIPTPVEKMQLLLMAKTLLAPPQVISLTTLWEILAGIVQNADQEMENIRRDQLHNNPSVQIMDLVLTLRQEAAGVRAVGEGSRADAMEAVAARMEEVIGSGANAPQTNVAIRQAPPGQLPSELSGPNPDMSQALMRQ